MKRILIAYATNSGSTAEVAAAVGEELGKAGIQVEVHQIDETTTIESYDAVVVGAPMIMGWHRSAVRFVKKHGPRLRDMPVAYFLTAMSLTQLDHHLGDTPVLVDPSLAKPPRRLGRLSFRERYSTVDEYVGPVLKAALGVKPISVGVFGGKLDPARLNWWQKLFVNTIIRAEPGDYRNWPFIRDWARRLGEQLAR